MPEYQFVTYEELDEGRIARIMLNRPETRNAQNRGLLVDLNDAFPPRRTTMSGWSSSAGSARSSPRATTWGRRKPWPRTPGPRPAQTQTTRHPRGAGNRMLQEWHYFFQNTLRWRNLRKITVAQVHGTCSPPGSCSVGL